MTTAFRGPESSTRPVRAAAASPGVHPVADQRVERRTVDSFADEVFRSMLRANSRIAASSVLRRGRVETHGYPILGSASSAGLLLSHLTRFARSVDLTREPASFVAIFLFDTHCDDEQFETLLRRQLQAIRAIDDSAPDAPAGAETTCRGFTAAGTSFDVLGLHPTAARPGRRAPLPMMIFNPCARLETVPAPRRASTKRVAPAPSPKRRVLRAVAAPGAALAGPAVP